MFLPSSKPQDKSFLLKGIKLLRGIKKSPRKAYTALRIKMEGMRLLGKDYYCKKLGITFRHIDPKTYKLQIHIECTKICGFNKHIIDCISENVTEIKKVESEQKL